MVWMENYLFYCSVRLGVLIISAMAFISVFIPSVVFIALGLDALNPVLDLFNDDEHFRYHPIVRTFTKQVDADSTKLMVLFQLYFVLHISASVGAFYGAYNLKKRFLLPLMFFELFRVIYCLACHILLMTVCKKIFNLGLLITSTLGGGFVILYLGYNWAACVAMYQIITLINSERYKNLYGDDPFKPLIPKTYNPNVTENVRVLITPNNRDIYEQKRRNLLLEVAAAVKVKQQPIISVVPLNFHQQKNFNTPYIDNRKSNMWNKTANLGTVVPQNGVPNANATENSNYNVDYGNWQWSELASNRNKNIYYSSNWK